MSAAGMAAMAAAGYGPGQASQEVLQDVYREIFQHAVKDNAAEIHKMYKIGCPPSFANKIGQTALHIGSLWGSTNAVKALLEVRANVNQQNQLRGSTPLHSAAQGRGPADKRAECVKLLLEGRADPNLADVDGILPIQLSDSGELREAFGAAPLKLHKAVVAQKLEDVCDVIHQVQIGTLDLHLDMVDPDGFTALHLAIGRRWRTGASTLLAAKASVRTQAYNGETPVHTAVHRGDNLALKFLLSARADVNLRDMDADADPRFKSNTFEQDPTQHRTPLHHAAVLGNVVAARCLLSAGADPNLRDSQQQTSLHLVLEAKENGNELDVGSGVTVVGTKNEKLNGAFGAIVGKRGKPSDGVVPRWPVVLDGHAGDGFLMKEDNLASVANETIKSLLEARADANLGSHIIGESRTALHAAARKGDAPLVAMLLGARAEVDLQDQKLGFSPLHVAVRSRKTDVAELLVAARADVSLETSSGLTAAELGKKNGASPGLLAVLGVGSVPAPEADALEAPVAPVSAEPVPQTLGQLSAAERAALFLD